jgi:hypothetical protein
MYYQVKDSQGGKPATGTGIGLSGMYITEKRKEQIAFSDKIYSGPVFLVARKNSLAGNSLEQLKGKTIGVDYINLVSARFRAIGKTIVACVYIYHSALRDLLI